MPAARRPRPAARRSGPGPRQSRPAHPCPRRCQTAPSLRPGARCRPRCPPPRPGAAPAGGAVASRARHAQLGHGNHFVGDGDVQHAASGQRLGLGHLLHARPVPRLAAATRPARRFCASWRGAASAPGACGEVGHALDVAVHGVQVHHQGGVSIRSTRWPMGAAGRRRGFHRVRRCPGAACRPSPPG